MQGANLYLLSAILVSSAAFAGGIPQVAVPVTTPSREEPVVLRPTGMSTTIGRISAKHVELLEAELQKKIDEARKPSEQEIRSRAIALPSVPPPPSPSQIIEEEAATIKLLAVYGKTGALRADVRINGVVYTMSKGGEKASGWDVSEITANSLTINKGKKTKMVVIQTTQAPEPLNIRDSSSIGALPPLPRVNAY